MRSFLISSALAAALALPTPVGAEPTSLLPTGTESAQRLSKLAPLASNSEWAGRFAAAADELAAALRSRDEARWAPLLGGQWLSGADRARVRKLLSDSEGPFVPALIAGADTRRIILGWTAPASLNATERAAIEAGQEAEALICWSAGRTDEVPWPTTIADADNRRGRPYACARIAYSLRGDRPTWRAFIDSV